MVDVRGRDRKEDYNTNTLEMILEVNESAYTDSSKLYPGNIMIKKTHTAYVLQYLHWMNQWPPFHFIRTALR